jgi:hypothetical protein
MTGKKQCCLFFPGYTECRLIFYIEAGIPVKVATPSIPEKRWQTESEIPR